MKIKTIKEDRKYRIYTNGEIDKRIYDGEIPPEGFYLGSHYKRVAWNKGLTAETDDRVKANVQAARDTRIKNNNYVPWNKGLTADSDERVAKNVQNAKSTVQAKYGVDNITQYLAKQPDYVVWNKGLTKETDKRMRKASENHKGVSAWNKGVSTHGHPHSEETKQRLREIHLDPDFQNNRYKTMKNNGTLFTINSRAEQVFYSKLKTIYSSDDIIRQYFDRDRYPFKCDFYIPSEDLFIEIHANWTHGGMPFDPNNHECMAQLARWKEKAKTSRYYKIAIYQWTDLDVRKAKCAKDNNLNFQAIYC